MRSPSVVARLSDEPRDRTGAGWLLRLALAVPVGYHGGWNLAPAGRAWWAASDLPATLGIVVGVAELLAIVAVLSGLLSRLAAVGLVLIFAGAVPQHLPMGFSFKTGGVEPLVVYVLLALAIVVERRREPHLPGALS